MADNVIANAGAGGPAFATDDIGGVHYPRTKVTWGADGVATDTAAGGAALPIQDGGNSITVDGTVSVTSLQTADLDTGGGTITSAVMGIAVPGNGGFVVITGDAGNGLDVDVTRVSGTVTVAGTATVTAAAAFPVTDNSGSLTVDAPVGTPVFTRLSDGTNPVTVTSNRLAVDGSGVTQPVSIAATVTVDTELPAAGTLADTAANPSTTSVASHLMFFNGSTWDRARGDITNGIDVDVVRVGGKVPEFGSGTRNSTVQRVTIATDDLVPVSLPATGKTIKRAVGTASSSGNNTVISAPGASKIIKVITYSLQGQGTVNAKFTDGAGGSDLSMLWNFQAREGVAQPATIIPQFLFKCTSNTALVLNLSGAVSVGYEVTYWDDDAS